MALAYVLSQEAANDIDNIFEFGEYKFGKSQAIIYLVALAELFEKLSHSPSLGRKRNEIKKDLLSISYHSHIVFYRKLESNIRILRVLYGGRDLMRIFE